MKPIQLEIPKYYDQQITEDNRLKFVKTKALLPEDNNHAQWIASIENTQNYQCNIPEIGEKYNERATRFFHRDREKGWELSFEYAGCKVYTYNWDDEAYSFQIYWFVISEEIMLQLVGICQPKYNNFYKRNFMINALDTQIDKHFDYSRNTNPEDIFQINSVAVPLDELKEIITAQRQQKEKARYLEENLKISNPNFYSVLKKELEENEIATIEAFMCRDWNMYYDLYNPENFSNPDSTIEWESNDDVFEYYENPPTDNTKTDVFCSNENCNLDMFRFAVAHHQHIEQKLLDFLEHYTFGNGGAYAAAIHFEYAKIEIERLHNTKYTNQEFLKRNVCLSTITIVPEPLEIGFQFHCSWDTEHGIDIIVNKDFECRTEY